MSHPQTIADWAAVYVAVINGPANAWGQHCHPTLGRSDFIMRRMYILFGEAAAMEAIRQAFVAARNGAPKP